MRLYNRGWPGHEYFDMYPTSQEKKDLHIACGGPIKYLRAQYLYDRLIMEVLQSADDADARMRRNNNRLAISYDEIIHSERFNNDRAYSQDQFINMVQKSLHYLQKAALITQVSSPDAYRMVRLEKRYRVYRKKMQQTASVCHLTLLT